MAKNAKLTQTLGGLRIMLAQLRKDLFDYKCSILPILCPIGCAWSNSKSWHTVMYLLYTCQHKPSLSTKNYVWPFIHKHQFFSSKIVIFLLNFSQFFAFPMLLFHHQATQRPHIWPKVNFVKFSRGFGRYLNHWLTFESKVRAQSWTKFSLI